MVKRKIVSIDEEKCNGCGLCIPNCKEGALQIIDGKARLISDLFCDGLGACTGHCPEDAISIIEREAEEYDERKVIEMIIPQGENTIKAHLEHLKEHGEEEYLKEALAVLEEKNINVPFGTESSKPDLPCGCPGSMVRDFSESKEEVNTNTNVKNNSELKQWPIQLNLLPPNASFFNDSDLLIVADCVGFANPNLHSELIKGRAIGVGCPKLDDLSEYKEKIKGIIEMNDLNSIKVAIMEVPCCAGLYSVTEEALEESGKRITLKKVVVGISGKNIS